MKNNRHHRRRSFSGHSRVSPLLLYSFATIAAFLRPSAALVHLRGPSFSYTFIDSPARFAVPVDGSAACGSLHLADPVIACYSLRNNGTGAMAGVSAPPRHDRKRFVLISRGVCSFERKVRNAQDGGFDAAIIYDDQEKGSLYSMIGNSWGIRIHAVFVSKMAGETMKSLARGEDRECCIGSSLDETAGTVLVISCVSLVVIVSVIAVFLLVRNCRLLRQATRSRPSSMKRCEVEVLPCVTFKNSNISTKRMAETCSICLEDYRDGETLRVLPCLHEFHSSCVDSWLTKWGTSCPVCKRELSSGG